jgi:hypothetical protein
MVNDSRFGCDIGDSSILFPGDEKKEGRRRIGK